MILIQHNMTNYSDNNSIELCAKKCTDKIYFKTSLMICNMQLFCVNMGFGIVI